MKCLQSNEPTNISITTVHNFLRIQLNSKSTLKKKKASKIHIELNSESTLKKKKKQNGIQPHCHWLLCK